MKKDGAFRADILAFASDSFGTEAERLWASLPNYAVLRHPNGKWYGTIMDVAKSKLSLSSDGRADILVAKCDPTTRRALSEQPGFLPAYHLNRDHWITVLLDGSVPKELAFLVLEKSYALTGGKHTDRSKTT